MSADPKIDLEYLAVGLEELERYLLSGELFWPLMERPSSGGSFLKLTVGNLLFSLKRLEALDAARNLSRSEIAEWEKSARALDAVRRKWQAAWQEKAAREYRSRFRQWANVLRDIKKDFEKQAAYYSHEVRLRVLLDLLQPEAGEIEGYELEALDAFLKGLLTRSGFIWEVELARGFPEEQYWYLYGELLE